MDELVVLFELLESNLAFASAISAVASAVGAAVALLVSIIAVCVSANSAKQQRVHNELSVRPIPEITVVDIDNSLQVKLRNHGSGPLRIESLIAAFMNSVCSTVVECLPELENRHWTNFSGVIDGRTLLPGDEILLIELTAELGEINFNTSRESARNSLSHTEIIVRYSDVYESVFDPYKKSPTWVGRNLE